MAEKKAAAKPKKDDQYQTYSDYGYGTAVVNAIPELKATLDKAIREDWTPQKFQSELQNTKWWKQKQESVRKWDVLKAQTPGEARRQQQQRRGEIDRMALSMGIVNAKDIVAFTEQSLREGWTSEEIRSRLAAQFTYSSKGTTSGQAAVSVQQLRDLGRAYGVPMSDRTVSIWTRKILEGTADVASFEEEMRRMARGRFAGIADELDKGFSVEDVFDSYRETAARVLKLNPEDIDLSDPKWSKAINYREPGSTGARAMNLDEWERELRVNKAYGWDKTTDAKNEGFALATSIRKAFGRSA
jgi:hypothetical protein